MPANGIFVFGSNPQGRHGAGNALAAKVHFGAKYGQGPGLQGRSYGIITKDLTKSKHPSISSKDIKTQIKELYALAKTTPDKDYYIAYSAKGSLLCGYSHAQLANMFSCETPPDNIVFEEGFSKLLTI